MTICCWCGLLRMLLLLLLLLLLAGHLAWLGRTARLLCLWLLRAALRLAAAAGAAGLGMGARQANEGPAMWSRMPSPPGRRSVDHPWVRPEWEEQASPLRGHLRVAHQAFAPAWRLASARTGEPGVWRHGRCAPTGVAAASSDEAPAAVGGASLKLLFHERIVHAGRTACALAGLCGFIELIRATWMRA